jgi:hypothetical protein
MIRTLIEILAIGLLLAVSGSITANRIIFAPPVTKETTAHESMQSEVLTLASVTATMIYLVLFLGLISRLLWAG